MSIYKLSAYDLKCTKISNGNYYVTTDTKQVFYDYNNIRTIKSVTMIATERERVNNVSPINGSLYYVWETNTLWTYNNKWIVLDGNYTSTANGYYYSQSVLTPTDSDVNQVLDNNGLLKNGSVVIRDANRVIKGQLYISNGDTVERYVLLTEEPDDWSTNYTDYYVYSDGEYQTNTDSTWASDTFYKKETVFTSVNDLIISSFLGGGIKMLPSGSADSTGALQIFSANTYTGQFDGSGNPIITGNNGELVFWGDMYITDGINRYKVLTSVDGYTYVAGTGIELNNTNIYILLEAEPLDWSTNYTDYYKIVANQYVPNDNPTWATDTFYKQETVPNSIAVKDYQLFIKGIQIDGTDLPIVSNKVTIPIASASSLGLIKIGSGLTIDPLTGEVSVTGGGSDVTITPIVVSGTKIADFEVDGVTGSLYAPSGVESVTVTPDYSTGTKVATIDVDGASEDIYVPTSSVSDLEDLSDVNISSVTDGQVLSYDSASSKWVNSNASGGASSISTLTDVDLTSLTDGQILKYDNASNKWINANESGGGSSTLSGLTDVDITTPTDGQILRYDNVNSEWVNSNETKELPTVTSVDEGKFLTVDSNGDWVATTISAWNGGNF